MRVLSPSGVLGPSGSRASSSTTRRILLVGLAGLLACAAGGDDAPAPELPTIPLTLGGVALTAEVADSPELRARGLMERRALRSDHGMVFVYPDQQQRSFWMKNTPLLLSIAYVSEAGVIVRIADMQPYDTTSVPSVHPAMYAIEVSQGWFADKGIAVGARVEGLPPASKD